MKRMLAVGMVALLSLAMVGASLAWALEAQGSWAAYASLLIAVFSFFFNLSGAVYLAEGEKLKKNISRVEGKIGKVAVAIPCFMPDIQRLEKSIQSIKGLEFPGKMEIFVLDDTDSPEHAGKVKELCEREGVGFLHRETREWGKAGALNNFLGKTDAEFLAIFDADEVAKDKGFLVETMGHFREKKVAFVQTNKECGGTGVFERAADYTNAAFVNLIQPINSRQGVGLFTGSCGVFRVEALKDAGGFPNSVIEDVAVSLKLLWKGWKSEHVPKVYAVGGEISSFGRFASQHMRYIGGVTALLPEYAINIWKFNLRQKAIMIVHAFGLHYVSAVQIAACIIAAIAAWNGIVLGEIASLAYLFSTISSLLLLSKIYVGSIRVGLVAYLLNFSVAVPRVLATFNSLLGNRSFGGAAILLPAIIQTAIGGVLFAIALGSTSIACAWWGILFLSGPAFLLLKR